MIGPQPGGRLGPRLCGDQVGQLRGHVGQDPALALAQQMQAIGDLKVGAHQDGSTPGRDLGGEVRLGQRHRVGAVKGRRRISHKGGGRGRLRDRDQDLGLVQPQEI